MLVSFPGCQASQALIQNHVRTNNPVLALITNAAPLLHHTAFELDPVGGADYYDEDFEVPPVVDFTKDEFGLR